MVRPAQQFFSGKKKDEKNGNSTQEKTTKCKD